MKPIINIQHLLKMKFFAISAIVMLCASCDDNSTINEIDAELNADKTEYINDLKCNQNNSVITSQDATEVASTFWTDFNSATRANVGNPEYELSTIYSGNEPQMYVFNFKNGGFVVVSATKDYYPILAYSEDGTFPVGEEKNGLKIWLDETKQAIANSAQQESSLKGAIRMMWHQYETQNQTIANEHARAMNSSASIALLQRLEYYYRLTSGSGGWTFVPLSQAANAFAQYGLSEEYQSLCNRAQYNNSALGETLIGWRVDRVGGTYGPLLNTAWFQKTPFNDNLDNKAGCGAIAAAQVANYYKHPATFTVGGITYNWNNIPNIPLPGSDQAALVKYVYNKINSKEGIWDTGIGNFVYTTPGDMASGLRSMGYNVTRQNHNYNSVISELSNNRPVIMLGNDDNPPDWGDIAYLVSSHYWVCDGVNDIEYYFEYFTEWQPYGNGTMVPGWYSFESPNRIESNNNYRTFHMNWGWGDSETHHYNGWFQGDSVDSGNGNFEHNREDFLISVAQ